MAANNSAYNESVAYDLSRFDPRRRVQEALANEKVVTPELPARSRSAAEAVPKTRVRVSAFAVVSYVVLLVLVFSIVMNYMILNEITVETARMESELADLESDAAKLEVEYERAMNIGDLAAKASEAGLYAPGADQIGYIDISRNDEVKVYADEDAGFFAGIEKILLDVGDYFSGE